MNNHFLNNLKFKHAFIWGTGWISLALIEIILRFTFDPPPLRLVIICILISYFFIGMFSGLFYSGINHLLRCLFMSHSSNSGSFYFSMSLSTGSILSFFSVPYIFQARALTPLPLLLKGLIILALSATTIFLLNLFFYIMAQKGKLFISYISTLLPLFISVSLVLKRNKGLFPSYLQITSFSRTIFLIGSSVILFLLLYLFFSLIFRSRLIASFLKPVTILFLFFFIAWLLFPLFRDEGRRRKMSEIKNSPFGKPNILLITLDTTRWDHLSCYGYKRLTTPHLDKFAREGVLYTNAYAPASWTLPSHASLFTGKYPTRHGAHYNPDFMKVVNYLEEHQSEKKWEFGDLVQASILPLPEENLTLAEILSEKGYQTAGIIGGYMCASIFGISQGFDYYNERFFNLTKDIKYFLICRALECFFSLNDFFTLHGISAGDRLASDVNSAAIKWLEKHYTKPFFLFINYFDPHGPHLPLAPYNTFYGNPEKKIIMERFGRGDLSYINAEWNLAMAVREGKHLLSEEEREILISRYDAEIRYVDDHLGLLFNKLKELKIFDNTLIIVTADHGEAFGEHGFMYHKSDLYEEVIHVPLIIKYPSSTPQGRREKRVSLVDILPTVLTYLGYSQPSDIDGKVLEEVHPVIAEDYASWWIPVKVQRNLRAIFEGRYKFIWSSDSFHELYDLTADPKEEKNLRYQYSQKAYSMENTLNLWLKSFTPPAKGRKGLRADEKAVEAVRALGYVR